MSQLFTQQRASSFTLLEVLHPLSVPVSYQVGQMRQLVLLCVSLGHMVLLCLLRLNRWFCRRALELEKKRQSMITVTVANLHQTVEMA